MHTEGLSIPNHSAMPVTLHTASKKDTLPLSTQKGLSRVGPLMCGKRSSHTDGNTLSTWFPCCPGTTQGQGCTACRSHVACGLIWSGEPRERRLLRGALMAAGGGRREGVEPVPRPPPAGAALHAELS